MKAKCCYCGEKFEISAGHYNRAKKVGLNVYCSREHSGLGRRDKRTIEQKKKDKSKYDKQYRKKNFNRIKKARAEYFKKDYAANPDKYIKIRQRRMKAHVEYCRRPEYKIKKKVYDRQHRAKKHYGDYGEAAIALLELARIVDNRQAKRDQYIFNKSQKRKRNAKTNIKRKELESCSMGLYQPS